MLRLLKPSALSSKWVHTFLRKPPARSTAHPASVLPVFCTTAAAACTNECAVPSVSKLLRQSALSKYQHAQSGRLRQRCSQSAPVLGKLKTAAGAPGPGLRNLRCKLVRLRRGHGRERIQRGKKTSKGGTGMCACMHVCQHHLQLNTLW